MVGSNESKENLAELKENDPIGYAVKVAEMTEKKEQLQLLQAEQQRIAQQQNSDRSANMQKYVEQEAQKLAQSLPEFSDNTKGEQVRNEIRNYGKKVGFTDEELSSVYDSRHVLVLHKAAQWDKLQKSNPGVSKKLTKAPKMAKKGNKIAKTDVYQKQKKRLQGSGSIEDATELYI